MALLQLVERIRASEIFFPMHRAHHRILARGQVFSTSIHEWNIFSSPLHGFRSCITAEGNLVDGNPPFLVVFLFATAVHNTLQPSHNKSSETRESSVFVLTSQAHYPQSPVLRCFVHVFERLIRGEEKLIGKFFFSIFILEQNEDSIQLINKSVIHTLSKSSRGFNH